MRPLSYLILFFLLLSCISCAVYPYTIVSTIEENVNFNAYRTYSLVQGEHSVDSDLNAINKQRIHHAIEKEIKDLGYEYSKNSDLQISWFMTLETKLEPGIFNAYYSNWRSPVVVDVYEYQEGSLVINMRDRVTGLIIWHAKATSRLQNEMPNIEEKINEVVEELFLTYRRDSGSHKINVYVSK